MSDYFYAEIELKGEENAQNLIRAFFNEFNSRSSMLIKGAQAEIEVFFDASPPLYIIESISECKVITFRYGKIGEKTPEHFEQPTEDATRHAEQFVEEVSNDSKQLAEEETSDETTERLVQEEISEHLETLTEKRTSDAPAQSVEEKAPEYNVQSVKSKEIPELLEIANKSSSFEDFVNSVAVWLNLGKKQDFFVQLIMSAVKTDKITWKNIEAIFKTNGIVYTEWDKIYCSKKIATKFKDSENDISIMKLVKAITTYLTFSFLETNLKKEQEETILPVEEVEQLPTTNSARIECTPEEVYLEKLFGNVDKTKPIEDRVKSVLTIMGLENRPSEEQQIILNLANTAVRLKEITIDNLFLKVDGLNESQMECRMVFARFINNYLDERVKMVDFICDLQKGILTQSEIESF